MQAQFKIIVIVFLAVCSYVRLRYHQPPQPMRHPRPLPQMNYEQHEPDEIAKKNKRAAIAPITLKDIAEFHKMSAQLMKKSSDKQKKEVKTEMNKEEVKKKNQEMLAREEYFRCIRGKQAQQVDSSRGITSQYAPLKIFQKRSQKIKTNQQHFSDFQPIFKPSIFSTPTTLPFFGHNPFSFNPNTPTKIEPPNTNTYNTFSFNINLDKQAMKNQDSQGENEDSYNYERATKSKGISKLRGNREKQRERDRKIAFKLNKNNESMPFSALSISPQKGKTLVCIEQQILKREKQIELLRALCNTQTLKQ